MQVKLKNNNKSKNKLDNRGRGFQTKWVCNKMLWAFCHCKQNPKPKDISLKIISLLSLSPHLSLSPLQTLSLSDSHTILFSLFLSLSLSLFLCFFLFLSLKCVCVLMKLPTAQYFFPSFLGSTMWVVGHGAQ